MAQKVESYLQDCDQKLSYDAIMFITESQNGIFGWVNRGDEYYTHIWFLQTTGLLSCQGPRKKRKKGKEIFQRPQPTVWPEPILKKCLAGDKYHRSIKVHTQEHQLKSPLSDLTSYNFEGSFVYTNNFFFRNKKSLSQKQLLSSYLCIVKQSEKF